MFSETSIDLEVPEEKPEVSLNFSAEEETGQAVSSTEIEQTSSELCVEAKEKSSDEINNIQAICEALDQLLSGLDHDIAAPGKESSW